MNAMKVVTMHTDYEPVEAMSAKFGIHAPEVANLRKRPDTCLVTGQRRHTVTQ